MKERTKIRVQKNNLTIRSAEGSDAELLTTWWNDGAVMSHAGFPNGLNQSLEETIELISNNERKLSQICIIEVDGIRIGEMSYDIGNRVAEIGIKICDDSYKNQNLGTKFIEMLVEYLFTNEALNYAVPIDKIILDTNQKNEHAKHVYEKVGFLKIRVNEDAWKDQIGQLQSSVDYEMSRERYLLSSQKWS
ncbi:GNAT family N-acetyltransferase [Anaerosporobacter sp.]